MAVRDSEHLRSAGAGHELSRVFLIGSPRSGTTWLQRMLGTHEAIVTGQETDLFNGYLKDWVALWKQQFPYEEEHTLFRRFRGLPSIITQAEFSQLLKTAVDFVHERLLALKPTAWVILEKNPGYSLCTELIEQCIPAAKYIHIVRDGRDVAASLIAASKGWGKFWSPSKIEKAAFIWRQYVEAARRLVTSDRYLEIRYEDISADGLRVVTRCFDFCGVPCTYDDCSKIVAAHQFASVLRTSIGERVTKESIMWGGEVARRFGSCPPEPPGFFRSGASGGWKAEWGAYERWTFNKVAGHLLVQLGYEPNDEWVNVDGRRRMVLEAQEAFWARVPGARRRIRFLLSAFGVHRSSLFKKIENSSK